MTIYVSDQLQATAAAVSGVPTPDTSWQWLRNGAPISGATSSVYYATADDLGTSISVVQSAINMLGTATATSASDGPVLPFLPSLLFRNAATKGVWYDPSDTTTLFQDAAGTTPVTAVEQPVGLMLDKSKGLVLGPELVTNWDFSNGTTGWNGFTTNPNANATINNPGGYLRVTRTGDLAGWAQYELSGLTINKWYTVSVDFLTVNPSSAAISKNTNSVSAADTIVSTGYKTAAGTYKMRFLAPQTTVYVDVGTTASTADFYNISVRELPGNHAFNPSGNSANFPVLSAKYNLLTKTEQFDDAAWVKSEATVTANAATAPDGTSTADLLVPSTANAGHLIAQTISLTGLATFSFYAKAGGYNYVSLANSPNNYVHFDLTNGAVSSLGTGWSSAYCTAVGNGWYLCKVANTNSQAWGAVYIYAKTTWDSSGNTFTTTAGDGTSGVYIWGADLRAANDALNQPAYQRVNTGAPGVADYDTVGFKPYLRFNDPARGTNNWLQTNSIDFTYGDKMFVSAGVRKLADPSDAILMELSADNNSYSSSWWLAAPTNVSPYKNYGFLSRGTTGADLNQAAISSLLPAPITNVVTVTGNISGNLTTMRINGAANGVNGTGGQGTGNYGNYPLYIGARGGSSLWANIRFYGAVVAGKQASASEITNTETFINQKTGAYAVQQTAYVLMEDGSALLLESGDKLLLEAA